MNNPEKQFVIQQHTTTDGIHWDLMLEMDDCLWTWRLRVPPADIGNAPIPAERIADHSLRFLTYEGPVQNNTGTVTITDKGTYRVKIKNSNKLEITFSGQTVSGEFELYQQNESFMWELKHF